MRITKSVVAIFTCLFLLAPAFPKEKDTPMVLIWPNDTSPVVRFTFGKFVTVGTYKGSNSYETEVTAVNVWGKPIPSATFQVHLVDKNGVRIGEGYISLSQVGAKETLKFKMHVNSEGVPASLKLFATQVPPELRPLAPPKTIRTTVYSLPAGAALKVDGKEAGVTPKMVELTVGKHLLEFSKEGFNPGRFPFEVGPDDVSGGNISFELGGVSYDTVELRDGSVVNGDIISMDGADVVVRVGGNMQAIDRNKVKRILLIEREPIAATK
jgi:PEGA domain